MERRDPHLREVFAAVAQSETGLSREQIERRTKLTHLAVRNAVCTLADRGFIDIGQYRCDRLPMGHPVSITQSKLCVLGVKILPSAVIGVVTDLGCEVLSGGADGRELTATRELPNGRHDEETVVREVAELVVELVANLPEGYSVLGAGVELGGHVNPATGTVVYSPNLQWHNVELGRRLSGVMGRHLKDVRGEWAGATAFQVVIENDVNALVAEAQWSGAGSGHESFALVLVGDGVGCGLVINYELVHGATGLAGELGHLVINPDNPDLTCRCGNSGCLETIAATPGILDAIVRTKKDRGEDPPATITEAAQLAEQGDADARKAFEVAGDALARAFSYVLNLLNPEALILETYDQYVTDLLMSSIARGLRRYCFSTARSDAEMPIMEVALERGAKGAAAVMITRLLGQVLPHAPARSVPVGRGDRQTQPR